MSRLPLLLQKYKDLYRRYLELEHALAALDIELLAAGRVATAGRARRTRSGAGVVNDAVRQVVKVLRDARDPLPPREIGARLGITPQLASRRVAKALRLGFIERSGAGRYRAADAVPSF